jgi:hypothetical protein
MSQLWRRMSPIANNGKLRMVALRIEITIMLRVAPR